ncbi:hypothetical protein [Enterococcus ureasiticus]|uniref:Lipoprotein n=1 Tax=Enterococcus ureasiticus TaxID=903984 RepID=A0A1E5GLF9_9ENTE|nr:hypothetical protein [Enterococcus ureasiticus]OEG13445.1 hypothetical protein BCR21_00175 [Enterococcus ureasiticus]
MKITRFGLVMLLSVTLVSLMACKNEKSEQKESTSTSISQTKDILASLGLENQNDVDTWETPLNVTILASSYMWAPTLEGKILEADNVFIATIEDMTTNYSDSMYDEKGELLSSTPITDFKLKVLDNLRGELPTDGFVKATRVDFGYGDGLEKGNFITLIENDIIPEKGKSYVFLARAVDGELIILNGGEAPSNFPLENAPMNLDKQSRSVVENIVDSSNKVEEIEKQVENEKETFNEIGNTLLNAHEIQACIEGNGNKLDMNKVIIK